MLGKGRCAEVVGREAEKNEEVERSEVEGSTSEDIDEVNATDDPEEAAKEREKDDEDVEGGANGRTCSASPGGTSRSRITGAPPKMPLPAVTRLRPADEVSNDTRGTPHTQERHTAHATERAHIRDGLDQIVVGLDGEDGQPPRLHFAPGVNGGRTAAETLRVFVDLLDCALEPRQDGLDLVAQAREARVRVNAE